MGNTHFVAGKNSFHPKHILGNVSFSVIVAIKIIRIITAKSIVSIIKILDMTTQLAFAINFLHKIKPKLIVFIKIITELFFSFFQIERKFSKRPKT